MAGSALWPSSSTFPSSSTYPGHQSTGDKVFPASNLYPGASTFPGQGLLPMHEVLMSFDDASASTPQWTYVTGAMRAFSITRGRENELSTIDAGSEQITFDNRDRDFDPTYNGSPYFPNLRPMNRVWHRVRFAGETHDLFKGYVDSYDQQWPSKGMDAVTVVNASDEFKVLALTHLPTTDPPRGSYPDVVQYDHPDAYWRMNNASGTLTESPVIGPELISSGGMSASTTGAIVGEQSEDPYNSVGVGTGPGDFLFTSEDVPSGESVDMSGLISLTAEAWIYGSTFATQDILSGPYITGGVNRQYVMTMTSGGIVSFKAHNGTSYATATATTMITPAQWAHVVGTVSGSAVNIYINGVLSGTAAFSGNIAAMDTTAGNGKLWIGSSSATQPMFFDEVAVYRFELGASRILAHYNAGAMRGFAAGQATGERIGAILDSVDSQAPRSLDTGQRIMQGRYMVGQVALEELRVAEQAEAVDAMLFVDRHGAIAFLDAAYRGGADYAAPAVTFSDDGRQLPYADIAVDYSEAFLANEWNVTLTGGTTVTSSDADSIRRYFRRSQSLSDLAVRGTGADQTIADAMLAKYKEPMLRITSLAPKMNDPDVLEQVFRRDLGDRIRVIRTPIDGQPPIDQQLFIQKIDISGTAQSPYLTMSFGVSPV